MASCPKRGVLNAGDRPARIAAAVMKLQAAAQPFRPRVMPMATRRAIPASTPMRSGAAVPWSTIGLGTLPRNTAVVGGMPGLGDPGTIGGVPMGQQGGLGSNGGGPYNPGTNPITHGALGPGGTSTGFGDPNNPLGPLGPIVTAITDWAQQVTDAIQAITDTISDGQRGAFMWAADKLITQYTEPLRIWAPEWQPLAIIAARIQNVRDYAAPILAGSAVEWKPVAGADYIEVRSIDGMQPNDGKTYLITFLYFGLA